MACERHCTSKLVGVDDLRSIRTFGFRGEALASASMVARVCITTRLRDGPGGRAGGDGGENDGGDEEEERYNSNCAYKMSYRDGRPDPSMHANSKPKPAAGRHGTTVSVKDLFHSIPSRRRALEGAGRRGEREEYDRILGVLQRYAVHEGRNGVGITCKGGSSGGTGGGKRKGFGGGGTTDLNTCSIASVRRLAERRKRLRRQAGQSAQNSSGDAQSQQAGKNGDDDEDELEKQRTAAAKDVVGHVFGNAVVGELLTLRAGEGDVDAVNLASLRAMQGVEAEDERKEERAGLEEGTNESKAVSNDDGNNGASLFEEMMTGVSSAKSEEGGKSEGQPNQQRQRQSRFAFAYRATGLVTNASYSVPKSSSAFLLFVNDRLVECSAIRRAVEGIYADTLPKGGKSFVYLSLEVPGSHVDVNVHPTKREVALLHEDKLCAALGGAVRETVGGRDASRTFTVAGAGRLLTQQDEDNDRRRMPVRNDVRKRPPEGDEAGNGESSEKDGTNSSLVEESRSKSKPGAEPQGNKPNNDENNGAEETAAPPAKKSKRVPDVSGAGGQTAAKRPRDSKLVRTSPALPVGAIEPFLVQKAAAPAPGPSDAAGASGGRDRSSSGDLTPIEHEPGCPLARGASVDMTQPGAFAKAICRCQVKNSAALPASSNPIVVRQAPDENVRTSRRPRRIEPTECEYDSVIRLRAEVTERNHRGINEKLRNSTYVGAVSRTRSLLQSGQELLLVDHRTLTRETFYQLALLRFKGMPSATLGSGGVDVLASIGQVLQFEHDIGDTDRSDEQTGEAVRVNKMNGNLARQATSCLAGHAPMLDEYFSIKLERKTARNRRGEEVESLRLTGLPVLLEGHAPQPHALPLFLLRLATKVDWTEEGPCFRGVCRELASFYSELPWGDEGRDEKGDDKAVEQAAGDEGGAASLIDDEAKRHVRHVLFPAFGHLLVPPGEFVDDGTVTRLADLHSLYKVFERC